MFIRRILVLLVVLMTCGMAFAADGPGPRVTSTKPGATVNVDKLLGEDKVLISVMDEAGSPIFGLGAGDFSVTESGRTANILSALPSSESQDVPRNIVLVLDNSYSMKERRAINAVLAGVAELMKIVRPIDRVHIVVFENFDKVKMGEYTVSVKTIQSSDPAELNDFAARAYWKDITGKTVLNDAMLAGLELINSMPDTEPRFMVVFSDGADLNSTYDREDVLKSAARIKGFSAYAIDYMPDPSLDKFLSSFTSQNSGQIWKAKSENDLVTIFQEVASKMLYYYVVSYRFPPTGTLSVGPDTLRFDEYMASDAPPVTRADLTELTFRPSVDTAYGFESWKATVSNAGGGVAEKTGEGDPAQELKVQLPADDLKALAAGGDLSVKMALKDKKGQELELTAQTVKVEVVKTSASMSVSPGEISFDKYSVPGGVPVTRTDATGLTISPDVKSAHGIAKWKATVTNAGGIVAELSGEGDPGTEVKVPLPVSEPQLLAAGGDMSAGMTLVDKKGQEMVLTAPAVKVKVVETSAGMKAAPASITVEEVRTIDSSPMLNQVFFAKGSSEIPEKYVRFAGPEETEGFDEQKFRDALEKYYQVLNIVGKRLVDNPDAAVTLVGCNDSKGEERKNKKLSTARAEAVSDYLQSVWGIAAERITVEARNLPEKPSSTRLEEGLEENRRVEIRSDTPAVIAPIQSTYITYRIDSPSVTALPAVLSPHGITGWKLTAANSQGVLAERSGEGMPAGEIPLTVGDGDLGELARAGDITVRMDLTDARGQGMALTADPVKVEFIQVSQRLASKEGLRVQEKYALILFDFDKDTIEDRNQDIVNRIADRAATLPEATMDIVGHTDNIGSEKYNQKLSERRALASYNLLKTAFGEEPGERINHSGVGLNYPLYDNLSPEARSFNRTVTITLEYMSAE